MLTPEQLAFRRRGIGSSEISTIVGENPFASPHRVWLDKRELLEAESEDDMLEAEIGHELEGFVARRYAANTGIAVERYQRSEQSSTHPLALATIDFQHVAAGATKGETTKRIVECKTVGGRVAHHWIPDDPQGCPAYVQLQCQWQMGVMQRQRADVPALFLGFTDFRIYQLTFNQRLFADLYALAERFWTYVTEGEPPPADETEDCRQALLERYKLNRTPLDEAEIAAIAAERVAIDEQIKSLKTRRDLIDNQVRAIIGHREGVYDPAWGRVTWKENKLGIRPLRYTPAKETKVQL